jgi:hypothetical protein
MLYLLLRHDIASINVCHWTRCTMTAVTSSLHNLCTPGLSYSSSPAFFLKVDLRKYTCKYSVVFLLVCLSWLHGKLLYYLASLESVLTAGLVFFQYCPVTCMCMYVCIYIYIHTHTHIYIYTYIHTYIHTYTYTHNTHSFISNLSYDRSTALPKRFLHLMRSRASSFNWEYPLLSPTSSSNCLLLLPRLLVTSIRPFIFPSITSFRRQFLRKIWLIQLAFRFLLHPSPTPHFKTFQVFLIYCPKRPSPRSIFRVNTRGKDRHSWVDTSGSQTWGHNKRLYG